MWVGIPASFGIATCVFAVAVDLESVVLIFVSIFVVANGCRPASVASYLLYGFGQLVENSDITAGRMTLEEAEAQYTAIHPQGTFTATGYAADESEDDTASPYSENATLTEKPEQLEIDFAKGNIDRETYERERELILKQAQWCGE